MVPAGPAERLLNVLSERGGSVYGSQQMLGRLLGVSAGTVSTTLKGLSAAGRVKVKVEAGRKGTRVELVWLHS